MWTCAKCGGNVGDQFSACQSCGTRADGTAAPTLPSVDALDEPPRPDAVPPPPELRPVVPPPPTLQERLLRAAKAGALYGALYGAMYFFIMWLGLVTIMRGNVAFPDGPAAALGEAMVKGGLVGAAIGVPVAVLFRLIFPYQPPKSKS